MTNKKRTPKAKTIFLIMPFNPEFSSVFDLVREAAADAAKQTNFSIKVRRADSLRGDSYLEEGFRKTIIDSDLIVADLSNNRPNVMYELGIAHGARKPVILIASETAFMERPFDITPFFVLIYGGLKSLKSFRQTLSSNIVEAIQTPENFIATTKHPQVSADMKPTVFISYSHVDRDYLARLQVHLRPLVKQNQIELWDDTRIMAGDRWKEEIARALDRAAIAVLLISADFLASDFVIDNELPRLLRAAEEKGTTILPLILKPCRFLRDRNLNIFEAINNPSEPLMKLSPNDQEDLYARVSERIENELQVK